MFIIRDLNSGLFYNPHGWTTAIEFAQRFTDWETIEQKIECLGQDVDAAILSDTFLKIVGGIHVRANSRPPKTD